MDLRSKISRKTCLSLLAAKLMSENHLATVGGADECVRPYIRPCGASTSNPVPAAHGPEVWRDVIPITNSGDTCRTPFEDPE